MKEFIQFKFLFMTLLRIKFKFFICFNAFKALAERVQTHYFKPNLSKVFFCLPMHSLLCFGRALPP